MLSNRKGLFNNSSSVFLCPPVLQNEASLPSLRSRFKVIVQTLSIWKLAGA